MLTAQTSITTKIGVTIFSVCIVGAGLWLARPAFGQTEPTAPIEQPAITVTEVPSATQPGTIPIAEPTPQLESQTPPVISSMTAIPPRLGDDGSLTVSPGEVISKNIQIKNNSDQSLVIRTTAQDFVVDDGETPVPLEDFVVSSKWSLKQWLVMTPTTQEIKPGKIGQVNVIIRVPDDALPGGHYAMITHQPANAASTSTDGSSINQKVGTLLYVIVDGPISEKAMVNNFNFAQFSEYGPIPYQFSILNQSDIHISPKIQIEIKNMLGRVVETITVDAKNIFPEDERPFTGMWDKVWGFGLYTAELTATYGTTGQVASSITSFWILPVKLILTIIVVILVLIASSISIRRHLLHRNSEEQKKIAMLEDQLREAQKKAD